MRDVVPRAWFGVWLLTIAAGLVALQRHAAIAAESAPAATAWPAGSAVARDPSRATLVVFVHPGCPCTRATLRQLERVVAHHPRAAAVRVLFRDDGDDVTASAAWELAARVPEAARVRDRDGAEARRFGARTSGEVMLFDAGGVLRFQGGVTPGRGHEGDNEGAAALDRAMRGASERSLRARVFGCDLEDRDTR